MSPAKPVVLPPPSMSSLCPHSAAGHHFPSAGTTLLGLLLLASLFGSDWTLNFTVELTIYTHSVSQM